MSAPWGKGDGLVVADLLRILKDEQRLNSELVALPWWRERRRTELQGQLDAYRLIIPRLMLTLILERLEVVKAVRK